VVDPKQLLGWLKEKRFLKRYVAYGQKAPPKAKKTLHKGEEIACDLSVQKMSYAFFAHFD
jgi:hypothetical protein